MQKPRLRFIVILVLLFAFVGGMGLFEWKYDRARVLFVYYWAKYTLVNGRMPFKLYPVSESVEAEVGNKYNLAGQFDKNDETGRTLVYYDREGAERLLDQYVVKGWGEVEGSDDRHLMYEAIWAGGAVPLTRWVRVVFDEGSNLPQTELRLDNLTPRVREMEILGRFGDFGIDADDWIQPRDMIGYRFQVDPQSGQVILDGQRVPVADWIEIRRLR